MEYNFCLIAISIQQMASYECIDAIAFSSVMNEATGFILLLAISKSCFLLVLINNLKNIAFFKHKIKVLFESISHAETSFNRCLQPV